MRERSVHKYILVYHKVLVYTFIIIIWWSGLSGRTSCLSVAASHYSHGALVHGEDANVGMHCDVYLARPRQAPIYNASCQSLVVGTVQLDTAVYLFVSVRAGRAAVGCDVVRDGILAMGRALVRSVRRRRAGTHRSLRRVRRGPLQDFLPRHLVFFILYLL